MISANLLMIAGVIILGVFSLIELRRNFSERLFFKIGMWLFIIQGVANSYGLVFEWAIAPGYIIISKLASIIFQFLIAYCFYYLMNKAPASMGGAGTQLTEQEVEAFMKEDLK